MAQSPCQDELNLAALLLTIGDIGDKFLPTSAYAELTFCPDIKIRELTSANTHPVLSVSVPLLDEHGSDLASRLLVLSNKAKGGSHD